MIHITDMRSDVQAERPGWLFKSLLAGGGRGYIVAAPLQAAQLVTQAIQYLAKVTSVSYSKQHETTWENGNEKTSCNIHLYSP